MTAVHVLMAVVCEAPEKWWCLCACGNETPRVSDRRTALQANKTHTDPALQRAGVAGPCKKNPGHQGRCRNEHGTTWEGRCNASDHPRHAQEATPPPLELFPEAS